MLTFWLSLILQWLHCILSYFRLLVSIVMYCNTELNVIDMFCILWVTTPFWIRWMKNELNWIAYSVSRTWSFKITIFKGCPWKSSYDNSLLFSSLQFISLRFILTFMVTLDIPSTLPYINCANMMLWIFREHVIRRQKLMRDISTKWSNWSSRNDRYLWTYSELFKKSWHIVHSHISRTSLA